MFSVMNLNEIERKAFRSTYQDGLWDIYIGGIVMSLAIFIYRPESGYTVSNTLLAITVFGLAYLIFWAGKKFITMPRMGQVRFGPARKRKKTTLAIMLAVVILIQVGVIGLTGLGWLDAGLGAKVNAALAGRDLERLVVALLGALFVGPSLVLIAYFNDFPRGYYIAVLASLAVFLMIWTNQPIYPVVLGGLIVLPGLVLFIRFLQKYPLQQVDQPNE